jgi:methyl-accepting chemotaxis protein
VVEQAGIASKAAKKGSDKVMETLEGMRGIKQSVDLSAEKIQVMGTHSDQIGDIVDTIEEIASQTNLLALNAALKRLVPCCGQKGLP